MNGMGIAAARSQGYAGLMAFERISIDHRVMAGVPCIKGTRIPVATVVSMVAEGMTTREILADFSQLTAEDVAESLRFAAAAADERKKAELLIAAHTTTAVPSEYFDRLLAAIDQAEPAPRLKRAASKAHKHHRIQ
jgi:uncharacterized protein (DUF433 family)